MFYLNYGLHPPLTSYQFLDQSAVNPICSFQNLLMTRDYTQKMFSATGLISGTLSAPSRTTRFDQYLTMATYWAGTISWTITTTAWQKPAIMTAIPARIFRVRTVIDCHSKVTNIYQYYCSCCPCQIGKSHRFMLLQSFY